MSAAEGVHRWAAIAAALAWLGLALIGTDAHASRSSMPEMRAAPAAAMTGQALPAASDCMPCTLCYAAPAPSSHGVMVEAKEFESFIWWVRVPPAPPERRFSSNPRCREHVPIRITFCRWLD
jgi:hypothetical protein